MASSANGYPSYPSPSFVPSNNQPILYSQPNVTNLQPAAQRTHVHGRHAPILPPSSFIINVPTPVMAPISFEQFRNQPVHINDKTRHPNGTINFDYYNFRLELETISHIQEQKSEEEKQRRTLQQALEEKAWNKLEQSKLLASQSNASSAPPKEGVLLDLDFDSMPSHHVNTSYTAPVSSVPATTSFSSPHQPAQPAVVAYDHSQPNGFTQPTFSSPSFSNPSYSNTYQEPNGYSHYVPPTSYPPPQEQASFGFASTKSERVFVQLTELGLDTELIKIGLELVGEDDETKLINFIADFQKLEDSGFRRNQVKHAFLLHDMDFAKSVNFLNEWQKLTALGISDEMVAEGLSMFNNQILDTSKYLVSYKRVCELGFDSMKVKEALFLNDMDSDKAIQYLLERS